MARNDFVALEKVYIYICGGGFRSCIFFFGAIACRIGRLTSFLQVAVRTNIGTLRGYLDHLLATTNMRCLTPESALQVGHLF